MKQIRQFLQHYKLFSLAVLAILAGLVLQLIHQRSALAWILGSVSIIEVLPLVWGMWRDVRSGAYGIDILAATAIVASVLLHQSWAAIVIVVMLTGGESLEDFAEHRANSELDSLLKHAPQRAHVLRKGKTIDVPVSELHVGDKILVKAGEVVPVDAVIIEGSASFDESSLTGESLPQTKELNDALLSGSINLDGPVTAKATATAENSQYQQIIRLVRGAASSKAPFVRLADRYSVPFTLSAFAIAGTVWVLSGQAIRFLEVIVVATPCPLLLAAPIALVSGMGRATRHGIIVKTGSALERLAEVATIAFDKTGTLTLGALRVQQVTAIAASEPEVLALAASAEQGSNHVVAQAIVQAAAEQKLKLPKIKQVREIAGRGLRATVKGQELLVGNLGLMEDNNIAVPKKHSATKQTVVYVALAQKLVGIIGLQDEVRPEAQQTLERLHKLGVHNLVMITGDNQATAQAIAQDLGIDEVYADMLPADKLHQLERLTKRPLCFVGDGVNDAPALTAADIGIALGARGSTAASESADMVIMNNDLTRVAAGVAIARRTFSIARQSIIVGILLSLGLMLVFATGKFPPLAGALLQEVVDVVVIFNALRAHFGQQFTT